MEGARPSQAAWSCFFAMPGLKQHAGLRTHVISHKPGVFTADVAPPENRQRRFPIDVERQELPKKTEHPDRGDRVVFGSPSNASKQCNTDFVQRIT
jgi:hypothetical protein